MIPIFSNEDASNITSASDNPVVPPTDVSTASLVAPTIGANTYFAITVKSHPDQDHLTSLFTQFNIGSIELQAVADLVRAHLNSESKIPFHDPLHTELSTAQDLLLNFSTPKSSSGVLFFETCLRDYFFFGPKAKTVLEIADVVLPVSKEPGVRSVSKAGVLSRRQLTTRIYSRHEVEQELAPLFVAATDSHVEDSSTLEDLLRSFLVNFGDTGVAVLRSVIEKFTINKRALAAVVRLMGGITDDRTHLARVELLTFVLELSSDLLRDAAAFALGDLEGEDAIPALSAAAAEEKNTELKRDIERLIEYLKQ